MTTEQIILDRVHQLPEFMHIQIIDYLEFLLTKYSPEPQTIEEDMEPDLQDEHKAILAERLEKYKNNESVGDSWENVKQRLMNRYAV